MQTFICKLTSISIPRALAFANLPFVDRLSLGRLLFLNVGSQTLRIHL